MRPLPIHLDPERLRDFCARWRIAEFAVFGSVLRDDFRPESDVDVLVTFEPNDPWSLLDVVAMKLELEGWLGRPVDIVEKKAISNPFRRHRILTTARTLYAA